MKVGRSKAKGKKYSVTYHGHKVNFGAKGYKISPGTKKGDRYCARSYGIKTKPGSPNYFSRKMWHCSGKKSLKR